MARRAKVWRVKGTGSLCIDAHLSFFFLSLLLQESLLGPGRLCRFVSCYLQLPYSRYRSNNLPPPLSLFLSLSFRVSRRINTIAKLETHGWCAICLAAPFAIHCSLSLFLLYDGELGIGRDTRYVICHSTEKKKSKSDEWSDG